jgi:hypothetical protein
MAMKHGVVIMVMAVLMVSSVLWAPSSRAEPAAISDSVLQLLSDSSIVNGSSSTLVRTDKGVTMTIHTSGLPPGAAHTVWWIIYNHPEKCTTPYTCDPRRDFPSTVLNATGHVIGNDGVGNFAAHLEEGDTSGLSLPIKFPEDALGLTDARKAGIALVVRTHGQPIPGQVNEQISMYNGGGCHDLEGNPPAFDPNDHCDDLQFTVFVP